MMEFQGVVVKKLPEQSGASAKGTTWRKQDVIFETPSEFNRKICVTFFGDKAEDAAPLQEGDVVTVSANVESREYNGRWYTDVKAWKIAKAPVSSEATEAAEDPFSGSQGGFSGVLSAFVEGPSAADDVDDLPF